MAKRLLSTTEAAAEKGCTKQTIHNAVKRKDIDGERLGGFLFVKPNKRFESWQPNPVRQKIGRESQKGRRNPARKRTSRQA